jgi:hypothetical protein
MQSASIRSAPAGIDSESLWKGVDLEAYPSTPDKIFSADLKTLFEKTPVIATPEHRLQDIKSVERNYFHAREQAGLVTPARTPSDILYRGPLYQDTSDEGDVAESLEGTRAPSPILQVPRGESEFSQQLEYHRERQAAIKQSIADFERKMTQLVDWHKQQEESILSRMSSQSSKSSSLRRGRSKLSERLYAAIDFNSN